MKTNSARKYLISGQVQGVGYRYFVERIANGLGLRGYVKNLASGQVEVYAMGAEGALDTLKGYLADGPRGARVLGVEESQASPSARYDRFLIEGGW